MKNVDKSLECRLYSITLIAVIIIMISLSLNSCATTNVQQEVTGIVDTVEECTDVNACHITLENNNTVYYYSYTKVNKGEEVFIIYTYDPRNKLNNVRKIKIL